MSLTQSPPTKEQIAELQAFEGLPLAQIFLITDAAQAEKAYGVLLAAKNVGFDTESKPTFQKGEKSEGPHVLQFSTRDRAYIFQSHVEETLPMIARLLESTEIRKIGFGLRGDLCHIWQRFRLKPNSILDLDHSFKKLGYRNPIGVKSAIAILLGRRLQKSKRITTTNWANRSLTDEQLMYAANDAYAALLVHDALEMNA
jgi:ribonuclease D